MACNQCGKCCKSFYLSFTDTDLAVWEKMDKEFNLPNPISDFYVSKDDVLWRDGFFKWTRAAGSDDYYPNPGTACPYLMYQPRFKKYVCRLQFQGKPEICRAYVCHES